MSGYPYPPAPLYRLLRDGHEVARGTEGALWTWLHQHHSYSVSHALRFEGYAIVPADWPSPNGPIHPSCY